MGQVGILSMAQLELHDHYDDNSGGPINLTARTAPGAGAKMISAVDVDTVIGDPVDYRRMKSILILENSLGMMDVRFTLAALAAGHSHGRTRIYRKNALGVYTLVAGGEGAAFTSTFPAAPLVCTEAAVAIDLLIGDLVEVWGYFSAGGAGCRISEMECWYTGTITTLSRRGLNAPLQTTVAPDLLYQVLL